MDENVNKQFDEMTEGMALEKAYDTLAMRAQFVRILAMHCGEIYKAARVAGLPRRTAAAMAHDYFAYETTPASYFSFGGNE